MSQKQNTSNASAPGKVSEPLESNASAHKPRKNVIKSGGITKSKPKGSSTQRARPSKKKPRRSPPKTMKNTDGDEKTGATEKENRAGSDDSQRCASGDNGSDPTGIIAHLKKSYEDLKAGDDECVEVWTAYLETRNIKVSIKIKYNFTTGG